MMSRKKYLFSLLLTAQIILLLFLAVKSGFIVFYADKLDASQQNLTNQYLASSIPFSKMDMKIHLSNITESRKKAEGADLQKQLIVKINNEGSNITHPNTSSTLLLSDSLLEDTSHILNKLEGERLSFTTVTIRTTTRYNTSTAGGVDLYKQLTVHKNNNGLLPTISTGQHEIFQQIDDKQAWMYSAFFDHVSAEAGRPLVRMFGLARDDYILKVYCNFSTKSRNLTSNGIMKALQDSHSKNYRPSYLECSLPNNVRPTHVSISFQTKGTPTNHLQIIYPGPRVRNFTVCYSVLHSNYNMASQLIESIELNRILGAEHFLLYNYSVSPQVDQILSRYQQEGLVTVLAWSLPTQESWYYAQMTALNDCNYRNRNISRFVVVVDLDEIIVPRNHYNWMDLINSTSPQESDISKFTNSSHKNNTKHVLTGCFLIRSDHFTKNLIPNWKTLPSQFQFSDDEKKNITKYKLLTLSQFVRTGNIYGYRDRSKYIARPELIYVAGIHYIHKFVYYMQCLNVDESLAIVNHYRLGYKKKEQVLDTSILKFKNQLYSRIMEQIKRFPHIFT